MFILTQLPIHKKSVCPQRNVWAMEDHQIKKKNEDVIYKYTSWQLH